MVKPFNAFDDDAEQYKKSNMIFEDEVSSRATRKSLFLSVLSSLHIYTRFFPQKGDLRTAPLPNVANVDVSYTLPYDILNTAAKRVWHLKLPMHVEIVVMGTPSEGPLTYSVDFTVDLAETLRANYGKANNKRVHFSKYWPVEVILDLPMTLKV
jgi:hypothetical protein